MIDSWDTADLQGSKTVFAILQTRDGYLWLGGSGGLLRFDGFRFELFEPANTPGMEAAEVRALLETSSGELWVGVLGGGVLRRRDGRFDHFGSAQGLPSDLVRALAMGPDGSVWVGTQSGVARIAGDSVVEVIDPSRGLPRSEVRSMYSARSGDLYIGTERDGFCRWRAGELQCFGVAEGLQGDTVMAFAEDAEGAIWVATTKALNFLPLGGAALRSYTVADGLASDYIFSLGLDRRGNLWVGTGGAGLSRFAGGHFANLDTNDGLPSDYIWAFFEDDRGSLWVGSEGGLIRMQDSAFTVWSARQGLPANQVHGLLEDREGRVWIAGPQGLSRFENAQFESARITLLGKAEGLPIAANRSLLEARDGAIWVSTEGAGLVRLAGGSSKLYTEADGLGDDMVWSLAQDRRGAIWAGTQNRGVSRFADGKWQTFGRQEGLGADSVRVLLVDRDDDLWAGTMGGGLSRIHEGRIETFTKRDGLGSDSVLSLYQDEDGNLWVGTLSGGLSLMKDGRFTSFDRRRGFVADAVGSIVAESGGAIWISAKGGPFRFERADLLRLFGEGASGRVDRLAVMAFGNSAGFLGAPGTGFTPAALRLRDGRLIFATSKGMNVVDPSKKLGISPPQPPLIESLLANHKSVDLGSPVVLPAGTYDLEIHYTAPSLGAGKRTFFRYRLVGFDHGWVEVGERRVAYYPNLPPGDYRFEVAAADKFDLSWVEGSRLAVVLLPYFYQTWWFKALLLALLLWALYGFYKLRTDRLEARAAVAEERNRLAREIHDTIAQDLTAILMQARMAQRLTLPCQAVSGPPGPLGEESQGPGVGGFLGEIAALAASSLTETRRSLQALRPPALDGKTLAQALRELTSSLATGRGVAIAYSAEEVAEPSAAVEVELLRIAKEAMGNALRHGGAKHLEVELRCSESEVLLRVRDDGSGFDPQAALGGFGLIGMRERAESLGGTLRVESRPGEGTLVEVRTPLKGRER